MKFAILVPDGMADEPVKQLGDKTPLEAAKTDNMDYLAQHGLSGLVQTIPDGMASGSDVGNLALLGYDPTKNFSGRAPLEAANLGIMLADDEVALRCNLVNIRDGKMFDYSAGHITTEEAKTLIEDLQRGIAAPEVRFYAGKSYRHLIVIKTLSVESLLRVKTTPPHDIVNQSISKYFPSGGQNQILLNLMQRSQAILKDHPVNKMRLDAGLNPADMIWIWGQGGRPHLPAFKSRYGLSGSVISAVDLVNGIGRLVGLQVLSVPGANGYYDTNYKGKADYAVQSLKTNDFVYVHVEAPDEAGHNGDWKAKKECIERFDKDVVGTLLDYARKVKTARILVAPDHPTPVGKRVHTKDPVPFVMYGQGITPNAAKSYSESAAAKTKVKFSSGEELIRSFLKT